MELSPPDRVRLASLPTPLQPLNRLSAHLNGPKIWIKRDDLTGTALTGNKVRKLEFVLADAQTESADVLITCGGVQSNHCRTTALIAAQHGLQSHLVLRGEKPEVLDGNTLLASLAGAKLSFYGPREYQDQLPALLEYWVNHYQAQGKRPYLIPTGASNGIGLWGYITGAKELIADCERLGFNADYVCCATGSGGTHNGLALGFSTLSPDVRVRGYAVCDDGDYFRRKADQDYRDWNNRYYPNNQPPQIELDVDDSYIGKGYGAAGPAVFDAIRLLARLEGILLDPVYTGKAVAGLIDQITTGRFDDSHNIVFVHTGGVFGLLPYREQLTPQI